MGGRSERVRVSVRIPPTAHRIVAAAAEREQQSLNDYLLEAGLMRAAWEAGVRRSGGDGALVDLADAVRALRDELREDR